MVLPRTSTTWTAQAMQGSKEWTVRRISSGCFGSATGVPISADSTGPRIPFPVARGEVPGARHDHLVVRDLPVFDRHPVAQRPPGRVMQAVALGLGRPRRRFPLLPLVDAQVPFLHDVRGELLDPAGDRLGDDERLDAARRDAAQRRKERRSSDLELREGGVDQLLRALVARCVGHQHARERADLHGRFGVPRCLEPASTWRPY